MKFIVSGDIHGDVELAKDIVHKSLDDKVDFLILNGDIGHFDANSERVIKVLKNSNIPIYFIPGNHDSLMTSDFLSYFFKIKNVHNSYIIKENVVFLFYGGATTGPNFTISESSLYYALNSLFSTINIHFPNYEVILITHEHPAFTKFETFTSFFKGNKSLYHIIKKFQPKFHFCSHVHEAQGITDQIGKTTLINVSRNINAFDLDDF